MDRLTRRSFVAAAGMAALSGCAGAGSGATEERTAAVTEEVDDASTESESTTSSREASPTAEPRPSATPGGSSPPVAEGRLPLSLSPSELQNRAVSGGPSKDGIPSIDSPKTVSAGKAGNWLRDESVVFGVVRNGEARAYPRSIVVWHEIVNDVIGGDPASITYCPLTGTALGFERGETTFGVSGRLVNNNLIMYDRSTEHWWPQVIATSIPSPWNESYATRSLREFRLVWTTWGRWREVHPDTGVLSRDTGFIRNYDSDPYGRYVPDRGGYYAPESATLFAPLNPDDRYAPKRVVIGARTPEGAIAFLKDGLREKKLIEGDLAGTPHLGVYDPALDTGYVYRNSGGAAFEFSDGEVVAEDGTAHAPDSLPLRRVGAFDAMWFAWIGFYPDSSVHE